MYIYIYYIIHRLATRQVYSYSIAWYSRPLARATSVANSFVLYVCMIHILLLNYYYY